MHHRKSILAAAILVTSLSAAAESDVCDFSIAYGIEVDQQQIKFTDKDKTTIVFSNDALTIDGKPVKLTNDQLKTSQAFQAETRQLLPKVAEIAVEGAELGVKAATLVVTSLFGGEPSVHKDLIQPIEAISEKIKANINEHMLNTDALEKSFDDEFEEEIENLIGKAMGKYSGKMVGQILDSIFSGDSEEMEDFEFRMENLERDIENYVENEAKDLELKADVLCDDFQRIAKLDKQLEGIQNFPKDGIIQQDSKNGFQVSDLNVNFD